MTNPAGCSQPLDNSCRVAHNSTATTAVYIQELRNQKLSNHLDQKLGAGQQREWWTAKLEANRRRDRMQNRALRAAGWTVVRVWQHELRTPAVVRKLRAGGLVM